MVTSTPLRPPQALVKPVAVSSAHEAGQLQIPRQRMQEGAVHMSVDSSSSRMEKKRKIQLDSIPE